MHAALSSYKTIGASFSEEIPQDLRMYCVAFLKQTHSRLALWISIIYAWLDEVAAIVCFTERHEIAVPPLVPRYHTLDEEEEELSEHPPYNKYGFVDHPQFQMEDQRNKFAPYPLPPQEGNMNGSFDDDANDSTL
ncbi:hypothetical protein Tco_1282564 [Tanacetum coccineum]